MFQSFRTFPTSNTGIMKDYPLAVISCPLGSPEEGPYHGPRWGITFLAVRCNLKARQERYTVVR